MSNQEPVIVDGKRVLGVVPGKPPAGDRKVLDEQEPVMVWPHLLIRHGVAALVVMVDRAVARRCSSTPRCARSPTR